MGKSKEYTIEESPFNEKLLNVRANLQELAASNGDEVVLARKRYFRQDEYIKLIVTDEFDILSYHKLTPTSKSILFYVLYFCLDYNIPTFTLKVKVVATVLSTDASLVYKGINQLIEDNYIAKTKTREVYWINHNRFYKGRFMVDKFLKTK
tara:strand:+ start:609 stop:1061 length:453 start_codon:yes stop_codon:yes gene_type:complete